MCVFISSFLHLSQILSSILQKLEVPFYLVEDCLVVRRLVLFFLSFFRSFVRSFVRSCLLVVIGKNMTEIVHLSDPNLQRMCKKDVSVYSSEA